MSSGTSRILAVACFEDSVESADIDGDPDCPDIAGDRLGLPNLCDPSP